MNRFLLSATLAAALGTALAGCVGSGGINGINGDSPEQQLEVHAILDHREVAGVGCLLANDVGRWFVVAPGRVTVRRSSKPLAVWCKRDGVGSADEWWGAHYRSNRLVGNILFSAGLRDYVDGNYAYAPTVTVYMRPARPGEGEHDPADQGTPIF
jgi:hypothetical protein